MKFEIKNRWTGSVQFTAEIDCNEDASHSIKIGMAVKWAVKNGANLRGADLRGANLNYADLSYAYLGDANLGGANLGGANLGDANLGGANLGDANLGGAYLGGAYLGGANLRGAYLGGANLGGADLGGTHGINRYIKSLHIEDWPVSYTATHMQIGCERHTLSDWRLFDDERIIRMDGKRALKFWRKWKDHIFKTIEMCPAEPTLIDEKDTTGD